MNHDDTGGPTPTRAAAEAALERLRDRDLEVLRELAAWRVDKSPCYSGRGWVTPRFVGGFGGSHHSYTLAKLARRGLAARHGYSCVRSWVYKCTLLGARVVDLDSGRAMGAA